MDELRCEIWDFLYGTNQAQSVETIARHVPVDAEMICAAIDQDLVAIARSAEVKNETRDESDRRYLQE